MNKWWQKLRQSWCASYISIDSCTHVVGKYTILFACLMHILWGILLCLDEKTGNATPIAILFVLLGHSKTLVIGVLWLVAFLAGGFVNFRIRKAANIKILSFLLIPQQLVLWLSAGAGLYASYLKHYADGTPCDWGHILADQLPISLLALLYTVTLIHTRTIPFYLSSYKKTILNQSL